MFSRGKPRQTIVPPRQDRRGLDISVAQFEEGDFSGIRDIALRMMPEFYGDINEDFVNRIANAHRRYTKHGVKYEEKPRILHVAKVDGEVSGFGLFAPKRGGSAKLSPFIVAPEFQSGGIGSALIESVEEHAKEIGLRRLYHHFPACSTMTQLFFTKHGYLPEARIREPYSPGTDEIVASKVLK